MKTDQFGVQYTDDGSTLISCPSDFQGEYVIPEGVIRVESNAFSDCRDLTSIKLPESLQSIGDEAFRSCYRIIFFDIPQSVTQIGEKAFEGILNISYPGTAQGAPWGARLMNVYTEGDLIYKDETKSKLESCRPHVTEVIVPEMVKSVNPDAFMDCAELTSVAIGLGTKSIKSISDKLFRNCPKLSRVVLGESVTKIGKGAFERGGGKMYENGLAQNLQSITLPASLKEVGWHGFSGVNTLKEVHISDMAAFCNIDFDEDANPLNLAHHLYLGDEEIHDLVIPEGVTRIQKRLFFSCADFTSVTIPDTVTEIGAEAFKGCKGLKTVVIPDSVTKIGKEAFDSTIRLEYRGSAVWEEEDLWWGARSLNGYVENDLVYDSEQKTAILGCLDKSISEVVLPTSIKRIGPKALQGCVNLKFITVPDGIEDIEPYAFYKCVNLQEIHLPEGVVDIDSWSFCHCERLTQITIPKSVKCLDAWSFHSCAGLETIVFQEPVKLCYWCFFGCNNLKHVIIPKGTKEHFLQQDKSTELGIKKFAELLEEGDGNPVN